MELMYLISKGDFTKIEEVSSWGTEKFLSLGEYLLRKRIVENIK
jgi:hypothetical protein